MRKAVSIESMKYSTRSSTPCSWRLHTSRFWSRGNRGGRTNITYRLIIEIGHPMAPGSGNVPYQFNQMVPESTSYFPQQNNMPFPPPYYDQSAAGFCSHCGVPRQNITAKFCSSCGQLFNM
ncbi:unnamed protein product [Rotaria sp. Silwood1]|nr:unnamed protein product [Rotaria sp. Silwood1]CAF3782291.1 unnamed protein product [Rotaria sp. Silwood1]CAF4879087.1 unnamed protein product [Rotaria sp. Silwood1]CAF4920522.1 unnamed protein product [Rotaria sp. Silwood1]CAF5150608.1 unnamed protein product [Rotaria sp. Silwood1]